jgi:hypothetical protein
MSVEDGVCVAECGYGRKRVEITVDDYKELLTAARKKHKTYVKRLSNKKLRRKIRK